MSQYPIQFHLRHKGSQPFGQPGSSSPSTQNLATICLQSFQSLLGLHSNHRIHSPIRHLRYLLLVRVRNCGWGEWLKLSDDANNNSEDENKTDHIISYLVSMTGKPTEAASAMVPGPAFVTRISAATMYSGILVMKPSPTTSTRPLPLVPFVSAESSAC